jgi:hypothetical protein
MANTAISFERDLYGDIVSWWTEFAEELQEARLVEVISSGDYPEKLRNKADPTNEVTIHIKERDDQVLVQIHSQSYLLGFYLEDNSALEGKFETILEKVVSELGIHFEAHDDRSDLRASNATLASR